MIRTSLSVLIIVAVGVLAASAQKLNSAEVVKRHLEAIGTTENRAALKDMTVTGDVRYNILRAGGAGGDGRLVFASETSKVLMGMSFRMPTYPAEKIVFDGKKTVVDYATSNVRSFLGDFLYRYPEVVNRALFGGTLTSAWVMYDPTFRKSRLEFDGTKKIDGRELYAMSVLPKGGSDVEVQMFFDKQTFQHVRTVYKRTIGSLQGATVDTSSQRRGQRQVMTEEFGDFRVEQGLTLPHSYRIYVLYDGETETREYEWVIKLNQFLFNQGLDPATFMVK